MQWERLYHTEAAFKPEVNDELDTQNFEKFEEVYKSENTLNLCQFFRQLESYLIQGIVFFPLQYIVYAIAF